jgi:predicted nucleic acid-binding protein
MFAIDASVVASWCFPDEVHPDADAAFARIATEPAIAPALLWFELRNVLLIGERRGRLTLPLTARLLRTINRLPIETDNSPEDEMTLDLARAHRLSFYDAVYLELAQRRSVPLATLDDALKRACRAENIQLIGMK